MTRLNAASTVPQARPAGAPAKPAAPAKATAPAMGGPRALIGQALTLQSRLATAIASGQYGAARRIQSELKPVVASLAALPGDPARQAIVARVVEAARAVDRELAAAPAPAPAAASPAGGPLAGLGRAATAVGHGLEKAGHVAFFPLEALGKLTDPARAWVGDKLGGVKRAINESVVGQAPVVGPVVRFGTGLASSLLGMVDGAVQGVTHPVDLIKGVGKLAGTVVGLVPGPKAAWDALVHGKSFKESYAESLEDGKGLVMGLLGPAIEDAKAGDWAGAAGRLTGDIGSLFLTGGAAGGAKVAEAGMVASRVGRLGKLTAAARAGGRAIGAVNEFSAGILAKGLKANFAPATKAAKLVAESAGARKLATVVEGAGLKAAPAAMATKAKAAYAFSQDMLAGEVRHVGSLGREEAIAAQKAVLGKMAGEPIYQRIADRVIEVLADNEPKLLDAVKGLKLNGKAVTSLDEAAQAWKALPADSPLRVTVGKKLASAMQDGFADGLKYQPAPMEFVGLDAHLAGLQKGDKVLLDPSLLNEDLRYLVDVMSEEQTHAYQRFLADNREAIRPLVEPRTAEKIDQFAKDFQAETYINPPAAGLKALASGLSDLEKNLKNLADHADEVGFRQLRREVAPGLTAGTPERAIFETWAGKVGDESERLSFMKFALDDLAKRGGHETAARNWAVDYAGRLPDGITHLDGAMRTASDARAALTKAIGESQGKLSAANAEVTRTVADWIKAYEGQSLEHVAKTATSDILAWMLGKGD